MLFVFLTTVLREGTVALRPEVVLPQQLLLVVLLGPLDEPRVQRANVVPGEPPNSRGLLEPEIVRLERRHVDRRQRVLEVLHVVGDVLLRFAKPIAGFSQGVTKPRESSARAFRRPGPFRPFSTRWPGSTCPVHRRQSERTAAPSRRAASGGSNRRQLGGHPLSRSRFAERSSIAIPLFLL